MESSAQSMPERGMPPIENIFDSGSPEPADAMIDAEGYRCRAHECCGEAEQSTSILQKVMWLRMAEQWRNLAAEVVNKPRYVGQLAATSNVEAPTELAGTTETVYRVYLLADNGGIIKRCDFKSVSDDQAIKDACQYAGRHDLEIWHGEHLVALLQRGD